jgi:hypothetical protein
VKMFFGCDNRNQFARIKLDTPKNPCAFRGMVIH